MSLTTKMTATFNQKFNILKALAMIAVLTGHTGIGPAEWFDMVSFSIPLFLFISGYFFYDCPTKVFICKKMKKLVLPFLAWNAFYGLFAWLLTRYGMIRFSQPLNFHNLFVEPFLLGHQFMFNLAAWFVGVLIVTQLTYFALVKLTGNRLLPLGIVCTAGYFIGLYYGFQGYQSMGIYWLLFYRTAYCLMFFYLGYLYKQKLEAHDRFSTARIMLLILINGLIITSGISEQKNYIFVMQFFVPGNYWVPLVSAGTGIYLCLQLAQAIQSILSRRDLLSYIGENSFSIMMHHMTFFWLFNTFLYYSCAGFLPFDHEKYLHEIYYRVQVFEPVMRYFYFSAALLGPLAGVYVYEHLRERYLGKVLERISERIQHGKKQEL